MLGLVWFLVYMLIAFHNFVSYLLYASFLLLFFFIFFIYYYYYYY